MNGLIATLSFELRARRELLLLGAAAALIALVMPLVPGVAGYGVADVIGATSSLLSLVLALLLALFVGAGLFGRDLAEDRLGFLFARPISGLAIWGGRLAAAVVAILACQLVAALPAVVVGLFGPAEAGRFDELGVVVALYLLAPVVLLLLAHTVGIIVRARTPFMALDLAGAMVVASLVWMAVRPLVVSLAARALLAVAGALAAGAILALLVASAVQVTVGRTSLARAHRWLSLPLWIGLTAVAAAGLGWSRWITSPELEDLAGVEVTAAASGSWVELSGLAPDHFGVVGRYLLDLEDGRSVRLPSPSRFFESQTALSGDGRRAVWLETDDTSGSATLVAMDLAGDLAVVATPLSFDHVDALALSADGERVAVVDGDQLAVHDLADGRLAGSTRLGRSRSVNLAFLDPQRVLVVQRVELAGLRAGQATRHGILDLSSGQLTEPFEIRGSSGYVATRVSPSRDRVTVGYHDGDARVLELRALPGGELLWQHRSEKIASVRFLADGSLLVASVEGDRARLRELSRAGEVLAEHDLGVAKSVRVGGQLGNGEVLVGVRRTTPVGDEEEGRQGWSTLGVAIDDGTTRELVEAAAPLVSWYGGAEALVQVVPAPFHSLLNGEDGALLRFDPVSGATRQLCRGLKADDLPW